MKARFLAAAAAVPLILAEAAAPVGWAHASDTTATVKHDARTAGRAVAQGATTVGRTVADKSREAGHAIADGARNVGRTVREGLQKLKAGMTGKPGEPAPNS
jgi:hypothetical protein